MVKQGSKALVLALAATLLAGCSDEDDPMGMQEPTETTFQVRIENISTAYDFHDSGVYSIPEGSAAAGPLLPGASYAFRLTAAPGHVLSFASMFGQSNDLFYGPADAGIALYDEDGTPRSGDVSDEVLLWDAGTEMNEEPGLGPNQAPRQTGPDTGPADPNPNVRIAEDDFNNLPPLEQQIRVTLTYLGNSEFMVRIENIATDVMIQTSDGGQAPIVISPGVYTVGSGMGALFTTGSPDRGAGLEGIAEDGSPTMLGGSTAAATGLTSPLAPGAYAVHNSGEVMFSNGMVDRGEGLEALAEDGVPGDLVSALMGNAAVNAAGGFNTPEGEANPGPLFPGGSYVFEVTAEEGDYLSLATMLVQTNDLFFAPADMGLKLFNGTSPRSGDITDEFLLWDAGTEGNQVPGVGPDQAPRQAGPDTGPDGEGMVRIVNDGFGYPNVDAIIRVTLTPIG